MREIRDRHEHVKVVGSLNLVQTLLREKLFDRLDLWLHPIVLGVGKKVFDDGAVPTNITLLAPPALEAWPASDSVIPAGPDCPRAPRPADGTVTTSVGLRRTGTGRPLTGSGALSSKALHPTPAGTSPIAAP
ncbi:dihydrofolate reductase family protein [Streptomyces sp. NPDC005078]|uniref:dihydrofolate reductase family protein n=1 Tax=unclassified Streptomyces TaxID=2593676 RepID=UPI0033B29D2F